MVEFNPTPEAQRPESFTSYSRGIETSVRNDALGELFGAVGQFGEQMVATADRHVQDTIEKEIYDIKDSTQAEFGVDDATLLESSSEGPQPLPAQLEDAQRNLERLQVAHEQDALKESAYWARLNSMVRQLRGKYPGYRAEIDQMVSRITGADPANALRASLFDEFAAQTRAKGDLNTFIEKVANETGLPADFDIRAANGNPYGYEELRSWWAGKNKEKWEHNARMDRLAFEAGNNTLNERTATQAFRKDSNQLVMSTLQDLSGVIGQDYRAVMGQLDSAQAAQASGATVPENVERLKAGVANLRFQMQERLNLLRTEPFGEGGSASYLDYVSSEDAQRIIEEAMAPIKLLEDAIHNENYGLARSLASWIDAQKNEATRDLILDVPAVLSLNSLRELGGDVGADLFMSLVPDVQTSLTQSILDHHHSKSAQGGHSVVEAFEEGERKDLGPEYFNGIVTSWTNTVDAMAKGDVPLEMFQNKVDSMFGPDSMEVLRQMDDQSRFQYFAKVASPAVTKNMLKLLEQGDVDSWENYQQWVSRSFITLFQSKVQEMQDAPLALFTDRSVVWDEKNSGFRLVHGPLANSGNNNMIATGMAGLQTALDIAPIKASLDQLNAAIRTVKPIIEYNDGQMGPEVYTLLESMGWSPEDQTTFWGMIMGIMGFDTPEPEDDGRVTVGGGL